MSLYSPLIGIDRRIWKPIWPYNLYQTHQQQIFSYRPIFIALASSWEAKEPIPKSHRLAKTCTLLAWLFSILGQVMVSNMSEDHIQPS